MSEPFGDEDGYHSHGRRQRSNNDNGSKDDYGSDDNDADSYEDDDRNLEFTPSEFDKALRGGKARMGHATSFLPKQRQPVVNPRTEHDSPRTNVSPHLQISPSRTKSLTRTPSNVPSNTPSNTLSTTTSPTKQTAPPTIASTGPSSVTLPSSASVSTSASASTSHLKPAPLPSLPSLPSTTPIKQHPRDQDELSSGVLPDILMTMRQQIESFNLLDSAMMELVGDMEDSMQNEARESLKRSSQQSISPAILVSLAHKRYERRRLAAMEIAKVIRSLVEQNRLDRVSEILQVLSDDYVRSTNEDARKGGVVALATSAIGLKKAPESHALVRECRDLILIAVVHACQDHSQRVRYYATESLFNVVRVIPGLAEQHFFILFEILRSLYADVDFDVRNGAELLDRKLKEVIVGAMNSGSFTADTCVPVFARFVYMRNKATKRLTLTWLQELNEKLIGAPILEFLHLFLGGIFDMIADPTLAIRQSALAFLQSVLPKLLVVNYEEAIEDMEASGGMKVDFDKILQSLVTTMEHPDPFVRKVAMYWMCRIVKVYMNPETSIKKNASMSQKVISPTSNKENTGLSSAKVSVRNSLPHVLPGVLLSIGDMFHTKTTTKDSFLPDQTTHMLASQTNACLQDAVRREGQAYVHHLDGFIVALREELDSPDGLNARNPPAFDRKPYRMDVKHDGTGIESQGFFRMSEDAKEVDEDSMMASRLCALHWVSVLYESVVPDVLKADYAKEFIVPIIHQLVENPPQQIIQKSLEVLAKITVPEPGEAQYALEHKSGLFIGLPCSRNGTTAATSEQEALFPLSGSNISFALEVLGPSRSPLKSRDREVFAAMINLHSSNPHLLSDLSRVLTCMCRLQPPAFVFVSFAVELEQYVRDHSEMDPILGHEKTGSRELHFVSSFVQQMCHVLLNSKETEELRSILKDCVGHSGKDAQDKRQVRLFHILLHSFAHNLVSTTALCLWAGAFRTSSIVLRHIDPLDINLMFLMELDKLVEMIERPIFRHLHIRMLECDRHPIAEGSGTMLFLSLKSILMILPQSTCFNILRDRLVSTSRFRQSVLSIKADEKDDQLPDETRLFVSRVLEVRAMHCGAMWQAIRSDSLEEIFHERETNPDPQQEKKMSESGRRKLKPPALKDGSEKEKEPAISQPSDQVAAKRKSASHDNSGDDKADEIGDIGEDDDKNGNGNAEARSRINNFISSKGEEENWKEFWTETEDQTS